MAVLIARFPWQQTPLGPIDEWPASLRTAVSLILNSRHPMWIGWGGEMTFLYNEAYLHVLGMAKHPWALGRPASEVWAEIWDVCGPLADKVFQRGEASFVDDVRLLMSRGDRVEETFYSFSYSPILDESGRVAGLFCPSNDVTAKVVGARRLRTLSELAANALVETSTSAACVTTAATLAKNPDDVPFAAIWLFDGDDAVLEKGIGLDRSVERALAESVDDVRTNGRVRYVGFGENRSLRTAVVLPLAGRAETRPLGAIALGINPTRPLDAEHIAFFDLIASNVGTAIQNARNIEEERRRAEALAELDRAKTVFFSNISHELRTPLTLILGPLQELARATDARSAPLIDAAHRNALRLLKLVNSLLEFSRIEAGRSNATFAETDLGLLTRDLSGAFQSAIEGAGLDFSVEVDLSERVFVDSAMFEKIVLNLLSNALKFTLEGRISVRLTKNGAFAELSVSDTGIGIPPDDVPHIFERFRQAKNEHARSHEGSGIGLALTRDLVELHGGRIEVDSRPGTGTTFRALIPLGHEHLDPATIARTGAAVSASSSIDQYLADVESTITPNLGNREVAPHPQSDRRRVLVVDDNGDLREYIRRLLDPHFDVVAVRNGAEALETLRERPADVIVSDVMMPRMNGFELLNAVRADAALASTPFILLSARAGEEATVEGLERGADDYLPKPFSAEELLARVEAQLQRTDRQETKLTQKALQRWFERSGDSATNDTIFRSFADQLPIMVYQHDATGALSYANVAWHRTLRLSPEPGSLTLEGWRKVIHPDDIDGVLAEIDSAITEQAPYELNYRLKPADAPVTAYRWYVARAVTQYDRNGTFRGWIGSIIDVNDAREKEEAERALREAAVTSERELRTLAETIPVIVWTADTSGSINWFNRGWSEYTGLTTEEAMGWGWQSAVHPDDFVTAIDTWTHALENAEPAEYELRLRRFDGTYHTFLTRIRPLRNARGDVERWYGSNVDIQAQREIVERSKQIAETLQGVFLPTDFPVDSAMRVDAVYQAAERDALVGGDWFDAIKLRDGRYLVSIGDVAGHGLKASTIAGRLRYAIRDFALDDESPATVLEKVNVLLHLEHAGMYATAIVGFIDGDCTSFTYASAGHPPPILAKRRGTAQALPFGGLPLGIDDNSLYDARTVEVAREDTLVLYTDGLVEYAHDTATAEGKLQAAVEALAASEIAAHPAGTLREAVMGTTAPIDDVAVLVVQFVDAVVPAAPREPERVEKQWRFHSSDARAAQLTRRELMKFVRVNASSPEHLFDAELILGELLANTVEHAPGLVDIRIDWSGPKPVVIARDSGPGMTSRIPPGPGEVLSESGRGLFVMSALADELSIAVAPNGGTELRIVLPLLRNGREHPS